MRISLAALVCLATVVVAQQERVSRQSPFRLPQRPPQGFRPIEEDGYEEELTVNTLAPPTRPQQLVQFRTQDAGYNRGRQEIQQRKGNIKQKFKDEDLEEEEKEEPDRLTQLLPQSKFSCDGKNTGYYADEGLACEVFHYCQDNSRHSWICPEGFLFHQVHLICMPPSNDNICSQSSQFHFVNDYLYKPINEDEVGRKPNVTLRYSERFYPTDFYTDDTSVQEIPVRASPSPQPQPQVNYQHRPQPIRPPQQQVFRQPIPHINNQVFHSPEEVNIPLQQRRPTIPPRHHPTAFHSAEEFEY